MGPIRIHLFGALLALPAVAAHAGERYVVRDAQGKSKYVVEQGMSGHYSIRDAKGQRIGTGYERMDGSIAILDKKQRRIGTVAPSKR